MIRSSRLSVKFANTGKRSMYESFIDEYRRVLQIVVDELWTWEKVPTLVSQKKFSHVKTFLGSCPMNCLVKQASGIVRGTKKSTKGKSVSKPTFLSDCCPELSADLVKIDWESGTTFDMIMTLVCIGKRGTGIKIILPLKKTSHFNRMMSRGSLRKGCRLSKKGITFMFESDVEQREVGATLGIDVGISDVWSDSRGNRSTDVSDRHSHTLSSIMKRLSRRKKGSKGFRRTQSHRDNFIGWSVNRINMEGIKEIKVEDLRGMKKGRSNDRFRSHWTYPVIFRKLEQSAEVRGVRVTKVDPRYTSQICSACGVVDGESRHGKRFVCVACGHTQDADLNAATNISRAGQGVRRRGAYSPPDKKKSRVKLLKKSKT